jgi:hypothetical protein
LFVGRGRGTLETLWGHLTLGLPIIVAVRTDGLPYWINRTDIADEEKATDHAVVVVGLDSVEQEKAKKAAKPAAA